MSPFIKLFVIVLAILMGVAVVGFTALALWDPSPTVSRVERAIPRDRLAR